MLSSLTSRAGLVFLALTANACVHPKDDASTEPDVPQCAESELATNAATWTLPALGPAWAPHLVDQYTNAVNYALIDLTGDARPDLVVASGTGPPNIGTTTWLVYPNTETGFAAEAIQWPIPALGSLWAEAPTDLYTNAVNYAVLDMTGDRRPDMVVASGAGAANATTTWLVFENTGTGFAAAATTWTLPNLGAMWAMAPTDLYTNEINYAVMNLHGDARPELVVASGTGQANVGTTAWLVFDNTGTGFSTTPTSWTLPSLGAGWAEFPYDHYTDGVNFALVDMQGDALPELVVSSGAGDASVGTTAWLVFANTGTGFATSPSPWSLPALGARWAEHIHDRYSDGINWGLIDLRGDARLDLVVASGTSDATVGSTAWLIHENTGSAFAATPTRWTLPALGAGWATEVFDRYTDGVNWGVADVRGDSRPELVITAGTLPTVGTTSWQVFHNICPD